MGQSEVPACPKGLLVLGFVVKERGLFRQRGVRHPNGMAIIQPRVASLRATLGQTSYKRLPNSEGVGEHRVVVERERR